MFVPQFDTPREINAALEQIERTNWLIENMLLMPRHEAWIRRQISVKRASATTRIEGASMGETEVGDLVRRGHPGKLSDDQRDNLNALQAYDFIDYLSDEPDIPLDEMVIRQLNREFLRAAPEPLAPGRYRNGQNTVGEFKPPDQGDVPTYMRDFVAWLRSDDELHPVLKAGIAHIHLVAIHPFWDGNGRVARGLATLVLQRSPLHFKKLLSLESYLHSQIKDCFSAIERTLGADFAPRYDATPWLKFWVTAVMIHSMQLQAELTDWHRKMQPIYRALSAADINHRQADGLIFAIRMGKLSRSDYIDITGVSPVTASRDLAWLASREWLTPEGEGRGRIYIPNVPADEEEAPPQQGRLFAEKEMPVE
jgi:Fic family protein